MSLGPAKLIILASAIVLTACGEDTVPGKDDAAVEQGMASAALACSHMLESLMAQDWHGVARAIEPSQRAYVTSWIATGTLSALRVLERVAKPRVDPADVRRRFQGIWQEAGVDSGFIGKLEAVLEAPGAGGDVQHELETRRAKVEALSKAHLSNVDTQALIAACLAFETKLLKDGDEDPQMGTWSRARLGTSNDIARMPSGVRDTSGITPGDSVILTSNGLLKAVQTGKGWFMRFIGR